MSSLLETCLGLACTAAAIITAAYIYRKLKLPDQEPQQPAPQVPARQAYQLPTLRQRPLKPAVDLSSYTYM